MLRPSTAVCFLEGFGTDICWIMLLVCTGMYQGRRRTLRISRGLSVVAFARHQRLLWRRKYACRVEGGGLCECQRDQR
jgi:hypothetical protein